MNKYNWKEDTELLLALSDRAQCSEAVKEPCFDSQYEIYICKRRGRGELKRFVPGWAVPVVVAMLVKDAEVKGYHIRRTYRGNIPDKVLIYGEAGK